jgi:hypothetical protein
LPLWANGQIPFSMTKLIENDTISMYSIVDNVEFKYVQVPKKIEQIYANDVSIDTTGINLSASQYARLLLYNNKVYFNTMYQYDIKKHPKEKKLVYSIKDGDVMIYDYAFDYDFQMIPYKIDKRYAKIYHFDPETGKQTLFADFWDIVQKLVYDIDGKEGADEDIEQIVFIDNNYAYIALCYNDGSSGDGCTSNQYFIVNASNSKIDITKKIRPKINTDESLNYYRSEMQFVSTDRKYIKDLCNMSIFNIKTQKWGFSGKISRLFDIQFNYIGDLLYLSPKIRGINIQKGIIQNYFLDSNTDTQDSTKKVGNNYANKYVMIPYTFNPTLELAMYKLYNSNLLTKEDIKGLEDYELGILRNLIFAKYNYAFTSEFYQAYFNLYEFYKDENKQKSRLKDVSHLLTETDEENIEFIKLNIPVKRHL